jgi:hypothetical protein
MPKNLLSTPQERIPSGVITVNGRIILKSILMKQGVGAQDKEQ